MPENLQTVTKPKMGLPGAVSANVLNMIGVGPFITIPQVIAAMAGPQAILGFIVGALLSLCDGLVWAELGSAMPYSGGTYNYLLEAFGRRRSGHMFSFLFLWQAVLAGPILIASGAIGFAQYSASIWPQITGMKLVMIAVATCLLCTILLYRNIHSIAAISVAVSVIVIGSTLWVIYAGMSHFHANLAFTFPPNAFHIDKSFFIGLAGSTVFAMYDYNGYNNVCLIGDEVEEPRKAIPRTIFISIFMISIIYIVMYLSVVAVLLKKQAMNSTAIISDMMALLYGKLAAEIIAILVMIAAFFGVYALILGYSRVPYAAAEQGHFFRIFAKLHPKGKFPYISLIAFGAASIAACFIKNINDLINIFVIVPILMQYVPQCVAVIILRLRKDKPKDSYRMPLFPLPALVAMFGWGYIFYTSEWKYMRVALLFLVAGIIVFLFRAWRHKMWPFRNSAAA